MGTLPAQGEYVIRVLCSDCSWLFTILQGFPWFRRGLRLLAELRPVKNITCMRSNEHLESRMYDSDCM